MRYLFTIVFVSFFGLSFSQDSLFTIFLDSVNKYRTFLGYNTLVLDSEVCKVADHHAKYLTLIGYDSLEVHKYKCRKTDGFDAHDELIDLPDFKEMDLQQRSVYYLGVRKKFISKDPRTSEKRYYMGSSECISFASTGEEFFQKELANRFFKQLKRSRPHWSILMDKDMEIVGLSLARVEDYKATKYRHFTCALVVDLTYRKYYYK